MSDRERSFADIFGECPRAKIIDVLVSTPHPDLNVSAIAEQSGTSRSTVYEHVDELQSVGIVEKTRDIGGSTMFTVNEDVLGQELTRRVAQTPGQGDD